MRSSQSSRRQRGVALFLSIGAITLLAVLASVFAMSSRIERSVSRNYADVVRARLLAQAGVERAVGEIRLAVAGDDVPDARFSSADDLARPWTYGRPAMGPPTPRTAFYQPGIPLDRALFCSFSVDLATGRSRTVRLAGRTNMKVGDPAEAGYRDDEFAVSGALAGTYTANGDFYAVKVIDAAAKIYLNGPDANDDDPNPVVAGSVAPLAPNVLQLLDNLSQVLNQERGLSFNDLGRRVDAARLAAGRNLVSLEELSLSSRDLELLRPHVTAHMWMDPSTLQPQALEHPRANDPNLVYNRGWRGGPTTSTGAQRSRRSAEVVLDGPSLQASCCSDRLVSDDPGSWVAGGSIHWDSAENDQETPSSAVPIGPVRQPRAPVNLNTAARETIQAVLSGLRGQYLNRIVSETEPRTFMGDGYAPGSGEVQVTAGPGGIARRVALALVQRRDELLLSRGYGFAAWRDVHAFIDAIDSSAALAALVPRSFVAPVVLDSNPVRAQAIKDTIKANADPNSRINKFNPDRALGGRFGDTDKADLSRWTTEFGFHSCGYFEVESIGRVCTPPSGSGAMDVVAEKRVVTAVKVYDVYRLSTQREFVANEVTGTSGPPALASYPEHLVDIAGPSRTGWPAVAAEFDGWLALATTDGGGAPPPGTQIFRAAYEDGFGPDAAGPAEHAASVVSPGAGGTPSVGGQSELFVDGLFSHETRRYPDYGLEERYGASFFGRSVDDYVRNGRADAKIRMQEGTVEIWVKPTWGAEEFPTLAMPEQYNPRAEGRRAFFTMGEGKLGKKYGDYQGPRDQSVCDNRIYMYAGREEGGTYLMATQGTRICEPWGWEGVIPAGPHPATDFYPLTGMYHTNWYLLPSVVEPPGASWNPRNWRYAGQWHHLCFSWRNDRSWCYVDGNAAGDDPLTSGRAEAMLVESTWSLFVGHNRFRKNSTNGYPCNADATLDDVRIAPTATVTGGSYLPPHRYRSNGVYEGRLGPRQDGNGGVTMPFPASARVLSVSWTVRLPRFSTTQAECNLSLRAGGEPYEAIVPDMSGNVPPELAGRGTRVRTVLPRVGEDCVIRIEMRSTGTWRVGTPLLDDVTVVAATGGVAFLYRFDE